MRTEEEIRAKLKQCRKLMHDGVTNQDYLDGLLEALKWVLNDRGEK